METKSTKTNREQGAIAIRRITWFQTQIPAMVEQAIAWDSDIREQQAVNYVKACISWSRHIMTPARLAAL